MIFLILSLLFLHVIEIWLFGGAYFLMLKNGNFGAILGAQTTTLFGTVYYSATVYTTIGFGDVYPVGAIRTMTGTEGVTGLLLITWSASFTFVEMLKWWNDSD